MNRPNTNIKDKIYTPDPLFYPQARVEAPQIIFNCKNSKHTDRPRNRRNFYSKGKDLSIEKRNADLILDYFV